MNAPRIPIAPEGWPLIAVFVGVSALLTWLWLPLIVPCVVLTVWCLWFFRDPDRRIPVEADAMVSPADGVIQMITTAEPPEGIDMDGDERQRITVYMNALNVHVNRAPFEGVVEKTVHAAGKFGHAAMDKASVLNERVSMRMRLPDGATIAVVQIAGLIARRIVCRVSPGAELAKGERYGIIRFGSRVDIYLPPDAEPAVEVGQPAVAGETIIARRGSGKN